jgi:hypothetical protein
MEEIIKKSDLPELTGNENLFKMAEEVRKMV